MKIQEKLEDNRRMFMYGTIENGKIEVKGYEHDSKHKRD